MEKVGFVKTIEIFMKNRRNFYNSSKETCIFMKSVYNKFSSLTKSIYIHISTGELSCQNVQWKTYCFNISEV